MRRVRVLSLSEAVDESCCAAGCDADPSFAVSTPDGQRFVCEDHLGEVADLPAAGVEG